MSYINCRLVYCQQLVSLLATMVICGLRTNAADLASTNTDRIANFWEATTSTNRVVTVVAFGDSLQAPGLSVGRHLFGLLGSELGSAGIAFPWQFPNLCLGQLTGQSYYGTADTNWWVAYYVVPAESGVFWTNQHHATGSLPANRAGCYYIAAPDAGVFRISISSNGAPWVLALEVDAMSSVRRGCFTNVLLPEGLYRMRIDSVSGTNRILGPDFEVTGKGGIKTAYLAMDGINLNAIFSISTNILYPVLRSLNPQLLVWHMKEVRDIGSTAVSNRMHDLEKWWRAAIPDGDVVYIGTCEQADDSTTHVTEIQNRIIRDAAIRDGRCYLDCMTPPGDYQTMTNRGFMLDAIHPNNACYEFMVTNVIWPQLGLFALGSRRELSLWRSGTTRLTWPTKSGVSYDLEASEDMRQWSSVHFKVGNGQTAIWTNDAPFHLKRFFRLKLVGP